MEHETEPALGARQRKRQQTFERIAEASLRLFVANGYEATTLDAIAAAAGISRRTFFYYYRSKDDVLVALQCAGFIKALGHAFDGVPAGQAPMAAVRDVLPGLVSAAETEETIVIGQIMQSSDSLKAHKQAAYAEMEQALFEALARFWPDPAQQAQLRLVAIIGIGVLRQATDDWREGGGQGRLADRVRDGFALLTRQF